MLVSKLDERATIPTRHHFDDAGYDLYALDNFALFGTGSEYHSPVSVGTGVAVSVPQGYVALVHPRSGLAAKYGITVLNAPGTIDAGYHGEVKIILIKHSPGLFIGKAGDRIAQLVIQKIELPILTEVGNLPETLRGESGFGSSGR